MNGLVPEIERRQAGNAPALLRVRLQNLMLTPPSCFWLAHGDSASRNAPDRQATDADRHANKYCDAFAAAEKVLLRFARSGRDSRLNQPRLTSVDDGPVTRAGNVFSWGATA